MNKETGGPAFASGARRKVRQRPGDAGSDWVLAVHEDPVHEGMTLRDYFAAKALTGAFNSRGFTDDLTFKEKADWVYQMADAMIEARKS